ncbi:MAG: S9 family peptidase [Rhodothermales bacterium]|nr:S9 family peptidase [Rhodothermales bacterium]
MVRRIFLGCITTAFLIGSVSAQDKVPLDHSAYEVWNRITAKEISPDGRWLLYETGPENKDATLIIKNPTDNREYAIPRGTRATFTRNSGAAVFHIEPPRDSTRQAKLDGKDKDELPADSLGIINLVNGEYYQHHNVIDFATPAENADWVAFRLSTAENPTQETDSSQTSPENGADDDTADDKEKKVGNALILRNLLSGDDMRYEFVSDYAFSEDGTLLAFAKSSDEAVADGLFLVRTDSRAVDTIRTGTGIFKNVSIDKNASQLAFISNDHSYDLDQPDFRLYHIETDDASASVVAATGTDGVPDNWWISEHQELHFSDDGSRLYFGTAPVPEPEIDRDGILDEEEVVVEVWSWHDEDFYPAQKVNLEKDKKQSFSSVYHIKSDRVVQLADQAVPEIILPEDRGGPFGIANSNIAYRKERSWDYPQYRDVYLIDLNTGNRSLVVEGIQSTATLSPDSKYVTWWDRNERAWYAYGTNGNRPAANISANIPHPVHNELHDWPYEPSAYGSPGWTMGDRRFLVYDKHDIWALDPQGRQAPRSLTAETGRNENLRFRYLKLDPDEVAIDPGQRLMVSSFDMESKATGYYSIAPGNDTIAPLMVNDAWHSTPLKAKDADSIIFTRESFWEFPDMWISDTRFSSPEKITDVNPQQRDFLWGSAELVSWHSTDGQLIEGILYKPESFDPDEKYPMMVYFYERNSDGLYRHHAPAPHRSVINRSFYASRGYLVFVPDIPYKIGYPGESAMNAVMPGVTQLVSQGFVDADNIGVQGHSWGGYQIAYMVTKTNLFKAAEAGAPVSNMTSAYGGVRWGSGLSRMFQYERTQSRIGGSLWEYPLRYITNSPIFEADKIDTPLLIMHNDKDGAVPWYQGIELFAALRRLDKPVWMINYNGEPHWPTKYQNKVDWNIRMQQFFDHYLKGEPAPDWLDTGVPEIKKGTTLGLERTQPASSQ